MRITILVPFNGRVVSLECEGTHTKDDIKAALDTASTLESAITADEKIGGKSAAHVEKIALA